MIPISNLIVKDAIKHFKADIENQRISIEAKLTKLSKDRRLSPIKRNYLIQLLSIVDRIIIAPPVELEKNRAAFDNIISPISMESKINQRFRQTILDVLGYSDRRTDFYPKYFHRIGIKVCIYCNSQLTVAVEKEKKLKTKINRELKAKFQVDHYWPKNLYPCFSVSLYNLYPSCANCNVSKSKTGVDFLLYQDPKKINGSLFEFKLDAASKSKYLLHRNSNDIKFTFNEPAPRTPNKSFQDVFDIEGIYNTQKDIAEEIILKAEIYTDSYKKSLKKQFSAILKTTTEIDRLILGNYTTEAEIHKRPMAKFTLDIAKQVKLIK